MSNLPTLRDRLVDANGDVLNGGKLYFYESGASTTPLDVFTTRALNVAHTQPVTADSGGLFASIWLSPATAYRVVLKDSSDVTIFTEDNIYAATMDSDTLSTQLYEMAENPNHQGALGTGSQDESSYVQDAIDAAAANSREGVVDLMGRLYRCDSAITMAAGVTLRNGTLDFSSCTANAYITITGGDEAGFVNLAANAAAGDESIQVGSSSGWASGDLGFLYDSNGTFNGELVRIAGTATAPTRVTFFTAINDPYTTANTARLQEITPLKDCRLENLVIIANPAAGSGDGRVLHVEMAANTTVHNCRFQGHKAAAIEVRTSINTHITGCTIGQTSDSITAPGINICDGSRDAFVTDCEFYRQGAAAVDIGNNTGGGVGGVTRNVTVSGCVVDGSSGPGIYARTQSQFVTIDGCHINGQGGLDYGVEVDGYDTTVCNCTFHRTATAGIFAGFTASRTTASTNRRLKVSECSSIGSVSFLAADINVSVDRIEISGNSDSDSTTSSVGGIQIASTNTSAAIKDIIIRGNEFAGYDYNSRIEVSLASGGTCERIAVTSNHAPSIQLIGNATTDIGMATVSGNTCDDRETSQSNRIIYLSNVLRSTVSGNTLKQTGTHVDTGVFVDNDDTGTSTSITGNTFDFSDGDGTGYCVDVLDVDNVSIAGNTCLTAGTGGLRARTGSITMRRVAISGNSVTCTGAFTLKGISVETANYASITGNTVAATGATITTCLELSGVVSGGVISGNVCIGNNVSSRAIYIAGTDASNKVSNVAASGNSLHECVYGLEVNAFVSNIVGLENTFNSHSTFDSTGPIMRLGCVKETVTRATMTDGGGTSGTKDLSVKIPAGALYLYTTATALTGFTGDTSAVITVGDGSDVDRYNTGTPSVFTTASQGIALGIPSGTTWHTAQTTVRVTITTNADFTNCNAGSIDLQFWYLAPI